MHSVRPVSDTGFARVVAVLRDTRGSVTAEFAVTLPAVVAIVALCIGGISLATYQLRLTSAVATIARAEARGENVSDTAAILPPGSSVTRRTVAGMLCVELTARPGVGVLEVIRLRSEACALRVDQ